MLSPAARSQAPVFWRALTRAALPQVTLRSPVRAADSTCRNHPLYDIGRYGRAVASGLQQRREAVENGFGCCFVEGFYIEAQQGCHPVERFRDSGLAL